MTGALGFLWQVEWSSPYTSPPNDFPRVLAEMYVLSDGKSGARRPAELESFNTIGTGYSITSSAITKPTTPLPREKLASLRRKKLQKRMENKYPMFSDQFTAEALQKKSGYYSGYSEYDDAKDAAIQREWDSYHRLIEHAGKLLVYGTLPKPTITLKGDRTL